MRRWTYHPRHLCREGFPPCLLWTLVLLAAAPFFLSNLLVATPGEAVAVPMPPVSKQTLEHLTMDRHEQVERGARVKRVTPPVIRPVAAPSLAKLIPRTPQGRQVSFTPNDTQMRNAYAIIDTGRDLKLPYRALVIAIGTALQESHLNNYGHLGARNDHDSQGLFQQRPSAGWGTPAQVRNPKHAATKFYKRLLKVKGWYGLPLTVAAQRVQISAFPFAYAKWEAMAAHIVRAYYGAGPWAKIGKK